MNINDVVITIVMVIVVILVAVIMRYHSMKHGGKRMQGYEGGSDNKTDDSDPDFTYETYDIKVDAEKKRSYVSASKQKHKTKDYASYVEYAFPRFTKDTIITRDNGSNKDYRKVNRSLLDYITTKGEDKHWTNQTLSYMRKDVVSKRIIGCVLIPLLSPPWGKQTEGVIVVDATANIGGDTLSMAMQPWVKRVISYEMQPSVAKMLKSNIDLYGLGHKVDVRNRRFDYPVMRTSGSREQVLAMIDPPFEVGFDGNKKQTNFTLSIDNMPIEYVVEKVLRTTADYVLLNVPLSFKYNARFAKKNRHNVYVYWLGRKNNKIYIICKHRRKPWVKKSYSIRGLTTGKEINDAGGLNDNTIEMLYDCEVVHRP